MQHLQALRIIVSEDKTSIMYIDEGNIIFSYDSSIGDDYNKQHKYSRHAGSNWASYIVWCLGCISYVDRIPDKIYLEVCSSAAWYSSMLSMQSYTQFYIKSLSGSDKPYVIISDNNSSSKNERHQKAFAQFKV